MQRRVRLKVSKNLVLEGVVRVRTIVVIVAGQCAGRAGKRRRAGVEAFRHFQQHILLGRSVVRILGAAIAALVMTVVVVMTAFAAGAVGASMTFGAATSAPVVSSSSFAAATSAASLAALVTLLFLIVNRIRAMGSLGGLSIHGSVVALMVVTLAPAPGGRGGIVTMGPLHLLSLKVVAATRLLLFLAAGILGLVFPEIGKFHIPQVIGTIRAHGSFAVLAAAAAARL
mmetsp:Transcript_9554/g.20550  ORF Transcript_9554/g.20550 Transcript_9554/m.20550 type:complete len:228 (-) Transcript_9554:641-1324(-)